MYITKNDQQLCVSLYIFSRMQCIFCYLNAFTEAKLVMTHFERVLSKKAKRKCSIFCNSKMKASACSISLSLYLACSKTCNLLSSDLHGNFHHRFASGGRCHPFLRPNSIVMIISAEHLNTNSFDSHIINTPNQICNNNRRIAIFPVHFLFTHMLPADE